MTNVQKRNSHEESSLPKLWKRSGYRRKFNYFEVRKESPIHKFHVDHSPIFPQRHVLAEPSFALELPVQVWFFQKRLPMRGFSHTALLEQPVRFKHFHVHKFWSGAWNGELVYSFNLSFFFFKLNLIGGLLQAAESAKPALHFGE